MHYRDMGLEAVEIVMAVEEAFDVRIEDSEAEKILTPRQLIDLVSSKVAVATTTTCLTHRAFNLLRKSLLTHSGLKRKDLVPSATFSVLIPKPQRHSLIEETMGDLRIKKTPLLIRPGWLTALLFGVSVATGLVTAILVRPTEAWIAFAIIAGVSILVGYIGVKVTTNQRTEFPQEVRTVGDLSRWIMSHKPDLSVATSPAWTRDQIAARVREIVTEILSCDSKYAEDSRFVQDLGLG